MFFTVPRTGLKSLSDFRNWRKTYGKRQQKGQLNINTLQVAKFGDNISKLSYTQPWRNVATVNPAESIHLNDSRVNVYTFCCSYANNINQLSFKVLINGQHLESFTSFPVKPHIISGM